MKNVIEISNLYFSYKHKEVFKSLSFSIPQNKITCIAGANSSGKTTLIKLLAGILPSKTIKYNECLITSKNICHYMRDIGIVLFEEKHIFVTRKAITELTFPLENLCYRKKQINERVKYLEELFELKDILTKYIYELTNCEKTILSLAVAVVHNPKILYLDNPFYKLTGDESKRVISYLLKLRDKENTTIVYTTTDLNNSFNCDLLHVIGDEKIILSGIPSEIMNYDTILVKQGLDIPLMVDMSLKLQIYGLLDEIVYDQDRMVDKLW